MDNPELKTYLDFCYGALETKQKRLMEEFSLGSFNQFELDLEKGEIVFLSDGKIRIRGQIIPIGCFNTESQIWLWAWANDAYPENLREASSVIKSLKGKTGIEMFEDKMANIDEPMAWEAVAMVIDHLGSEGVYRSAVEKTQYFLAVSGMTHVDS